MRLFSLPDSDRIADACYYGCSGDLFLTSTLRVHLDDVPATNAPLLIAPGSHKHGRVPVELIDGVVRECGTFTCLADAGDVWVYATPILHASDAAAVPARRRVLQLDYAASELPGELEWLGV
jgi:ectoine hydroxylase-related dioxygenase (phytanoyl-CoA dioxygenase family)